MAFDSSAVLFAIQAGSKLGRGIHDALVDRSVELSLILPLGKVSSGEYADAVGFQTQSQPAAGYATGRTLCGLAGRPAHQGL